MIANGLARQKVPKPKTKLDFDPKENMFVAFGKDRRALAQRVLWGMVYPLAMKEVIKKGRLYDGVRKPDPYFWQWNAQHSKMIKQSRNTTALQG